MRDMLTVSSPLSPPDPRASYIRDMTTRSRYCLQCRLVLFAAHKIVQGERTLVWIVTGARMGIDPGVIAEHPDELCEPYPYAEYESAEGWAWSGQ